ncbi:hypothetical protein [Flavobacterium fluviatile]|uniref:hypothetical protein n=1 Tax=Flavobacterium fluviatile TaxID=1862387 RepID=UPI0013D244C3|nr:hypothetical protein [Flavobacterium fluviatile]
MNLLKILPAIVVLFLASNPVKAQKLPVLSEINCPVTQNDLLLDGKLFASAPPILLRVFNEDSEYAVLQLGKRKSSLYLYFKIFTDNVCVKQEQPLELYFKNGDMYILKNSFAVNCDGTAVMELSGADIKKLNANTINSIKFYTLKKDYEFSPSAVDNQNLKHYLNCLKVYKIRKK